MIPPEYHAWTDLYVFSEWIIRIGMLLVVPFRRSPSAANAWLLLAFFLPWPGLLLYLFIGRPRYPRRRAEQFKRLPAMFAPIRERLRTAHPEITDPELPPGLAQAVKLVHTLGQFRAVGHNAVELLGDYEGALARLIADIDAAKRHVHLFYYIFADDPTGLRVISALARAQKRGVVCRVLIDHLGSRRWGKAVLARMAEAGVVAAVALPVHFFRRGSARADLRNHRKIAVLDGLVGYTGSQNLVDPNFKPGVVNQELVVRLTGPAVLQLQGTFVTDWFMECGEALTSKEIFPDPEIAGDVVAQVLPSGPDYPAMNAQRLIVAAVHGARKRIVLTTPYFVPDEPLLQALQTAVMRGVEVHLIVSKVADQLLVCLAQRSNYDFLLQAGVQIHLYRDKLLHAKHLSFDDELAIIGSSNLDIRSFELNAEVSVLFYDRGVVACLREEQDRYLAASDRLSPDEWARRPFRAKLGENLARLMSPLL